MQERFREPADWPFGGAAAAAPGFELGLLVTVFSG